MKMFINSMLEKGVSIEEISIMCMENPQKLILV